MKKMLLTILFSVLFVSVVNAETNKLYFTTTGDRIYYDGSLFDEDIFINHTDMVPGSQFEDTLVIENGTHVDYNVYFKIVESEQDENAIELLKNVSMKIYLDEHLLYEGDATGLVDDNGVDLQNYISLGMIEDRSSVILTVQTKLNEGYEVPDGSDESVIDWEFYATYTDPSGVEGELQPIEPNPDTGDFKLKSVVTLLIGVLVVILSILSVMVLFRRKNA